MPTREPNNNNPSNNQPNKKQSRGTEKYKKRIINPEDLHQDVELDVKLNVDWDKELKELKSLAGDLEDQLKNMGEVSKKNLIDIFDLTQNLISEAKKSYKIDEKRAQQQKQIVDIIQEQLRYIDAGNVSALKNFDIEDELIKLKLKKGTLEYKQAEQILSKVKQKIDFLIAENKYGMSNLELMKMEDDILKEQISKFANIENSIKRFFITMKVLSSNPKIAGALFAATLANHAKNFAQSMLEARKQIGLSGKESIELAKTLGQASLEGLKLGISFGEARESAQALINELKNIHAINKEAIKEVSKLSAYYGVSASEGAKLYNLFTQLEPVTGKTAKYMFESYKHIAKINGVPIGSLMNEIAQNSEWFALHAKNGGENIANAAAMALKLGLNLSDVQTIADNLMNIESSIGAELEASVFTGKQLNFNLARQYAMLGDYDKMMKEILKNQFTLNDWERWNYIQKQKVAQALGLSVEKMQTLIANQQKLNKIYAENDSWLSQHLVKLQAIAKNVWEYKDSIITGVNFLASMSMIWKNMGGFIARIGMGMKNLVVNTFKWIGGLLKGQALQKVFEQKSLASKITPIKEKISPKGISGRIEKQALSVKKMEGEIKQPKTLQQNSLVGWLNEWKKLDWKAVLKFSAVAGILILSLPLTAKALQSFDNVQWESVLKGMGSLLALVLEMKLIGSLNVGILKGALALGIMSAALIPLGIALNKFNEVKWDSLAKAGVALLGLTAALMGLGALMTTGVGAVLFGAGVVAITALGLSLITLGLGLQAVTSPLQSLVPIIQQLQQTSFEGIGQGFMEMAMGITSLAGSLLMITPLIPSLAILTKITGEYNKIKSGNIERQETKKQEYQNQIINRLDKIISIMEKGIGGDVKIGDREVGKYLGLKLSSMKVNGI